MLFNFKGLIFESRLHNVYRDSRMFARQPQLQAFVCVYAGCVQAQYRVQITHILAALRA